MERFKSLPQVITPFEVWSVSCGLPETGLGWRTITAGESSSPPACCTLKASSDRGGAYPATVHPSPDCNFFPMEGNGSPHKKPGPGQK
ncbi:hypothetical protein AVEN_259679-1 [Araneus ventricosus]|uniref:Uncharacterized protein n=1 Tax=Araneus ventricosus TaxID=182803 RepID=A0A4Y2DAR5_ARAVE|nr:hypothetical protein AVEN_259679-1 [Araneus ventricosus]